MAEAELTQQRDNASGNVCIECGLCCDGSMFDKARINKHDDLAFLQQMGVGSFTVGDKKFFQLPCRAQEGKLCRLYNDERRFKICRTFQCKLLKQYLSGKISYRTAMAIIREIRMRRQSIKAFSKILNENQNCDEPAILSFIRELYHSGKLKDLTFRRSYAKQILDCIIFKELLKKRFYKKNSKVSLRS